MKRLMFALALLSAARVEAAPIVVGLDTFDVRFSVASSVALIPGIAGTVTAQLENLGSLPIAFQSWNGAWNFQADGWAIGEGGISVGPFLHIAGGNASVSPATLTSPPNYAHLSAVTIAPGASLTFALWSVLLDASTPLDQTGSFQTFTELTNGGALMQGWVSDRYSVAWTAADVAGAGNLATIALTNKVVTEPTEPTAPLPAPEPATAALLLAGLAGPASLRRSWRMPRRNGPSTC